jgi:CIC family chloride channel protein
MRTLVGCGAAGAIAAAFGAPLTGSFYAFELIVGTYTIAGLAPIASAAIAGVMVSQALGLEHGFAGQAIFQPDLTTGRLVTLVALAAICAAFGVGIMRGVTLVEQLFKKSRIPGVLQPAVGGLIVGGLALVTPQVLSSGHGALFDLFVRYRPTILMLVMLIALKAIASAVSLGSGFRGGLFSASLFLGAMLGKLFASLVIVAAPPSLAPDPLVCAIVGMAALAVAVVGGPLTMGFLALETTTDFPLTMMVLATSTVVSVVVRQTFGFSFTTWRMHLRGESIRSAHDIGWMRALTVERLMRADVRTAEVGTTVARFREQFPLGSAQRIVVVDEAGRYQGIVMLSDAHLARHDETASSSDLRPLLRLQDSVLLPWMNIKQAAERFEQSESEALAVVDSLAQRQVVGLLSEAHVLRRYAEELEKARRDLAGGDWVPE